MNSDSKDILKLVLILILLLVIAWCLSFFTTFDSVHKKLLFSSYDLDSWHSVKVDNILYKIKETKNVSKQKVSSFVIAPAQWNTIQQDWSQIYVLEEIKKLPLTIADQFQTAPCLSVITKNQNQKICLGDVNNSTGNFWIQIDDLFYLARTEMYFEGLYQSDVEGMRLSYHRLKSYFTEPFKNWYGQNFWSNAQQWSLKTKKSTLFSLNTDADLLYPSITQNIEIHREAIIEYLRKWIHWIPSHVTFKKKEEITTFDFIFEITLKDGSIMKLAVLNDGLYDLDREIFWQTSTQLMDQFIVLPDAFFQKAIKSLTILWKEMQTSKDLTLKWIHKKLGTAQVLLAKDLVTQKQWQQFFCLFSGCLAQGISVVMKVAELNDQEYLMKIQSADRELHIQEKIYYFKHDTYRLEVITSDREQFIFISRIKEIYP